MGMSKGHGVTVSVESPPAGPQRDADRIEMANLPRWPMPPRVVGRRETYQVLMRRSVLNDIRAHAQSQPDVEVCGVLVGTLFRDAIGPWGFVAANLRGNYAAGRNAQVTFTSETWTDIHHQMEERFPRQRILGWYHSHPGFGIFLSDMDLFIHEHFFSGPCQIAFVDDPKGGDRGLFVWRRGRAVREEYLIDEDLGPQSGQFEPLPTAEAPGHEEFHEVPAGRRGAAFPLWTIGCAGIGFLAALIGFVVWWNR
ncbi:MAG TPA: Mov34/MPN/PAD-1 family protein [Tepidisphaeraceae bacterium]|nr:Mov34/MPN/PAD-1 family protein [Tepidisphaeraceae bacterium]